MQLLQLTLLVVYNLIKLTHLLLHSHLPGHPLLPHSLLQPHTLLPELLMNLNPLLLTAFRLYPAFRGQLKLLLQYVDQIALAVEIVVALDE
jgi:hypothetical protein